MLGLSMNIYFFFLFSQVSSFCQEALAVANSIIHPRSFPQGCSAPGPLLLGTPENPSANSLLSVDHGSMSESSSSYRKNQMAISENVLSQQSLFESNSLNVIACSQTDQMSVEHRDRDYIETTEGSKSFTDVGITPMEGIGHETTGEQIEQSNTSRKENSSQKQESHNEAVNLDSEVTGTGLITSSVNTMRTQLSNQEKYIKNTNQMSVSENLSSKAVVYSPQQLEKMPNSKNTVGLSKPKQRRIEDPNTGKEKQRENDIATFEHNKDQPTETITENENVTIEVSKILFSSKHLWLFI